MLRFKISDFLGGGFGFFYIIVYLVSSSEIYHGDKGINHYHNFDIIGLHLKNWFQF